MYGDDQTLIKIPVSSGFVVSCWVFWIVSCYCVGASDLNTGWGLGLYLGAEGSM